MIECKATSIFDSDYINQYNFDGIPFRREFLTLLNFVSLCNSSSIEWLSMPGHSDGAIDKGLTLTTLLMRVLTYDLFKIIWLC